MDLATGTVDKHFSAGQVTVTKVDTADDDHIALTGSITARREPDGVVWLGTDRFATANEGDYEGGSRGWSVFDTTGKVVYDAGNSLEHLAVTHGLYPDKRSDAKGVELENVAAGVFGGVPFLAGRRGCQGPGEQARPPRRGGRRAAGERPARRRHPTT